MKQYTCKCGATIKIETDDKKYAEKRIKEFINRHKCPTKCPKKQGASS